MTAPVRIIIVNEQDDIIGCKPRGTLAKEDIYRVAALWITNSNGHILLAQRAFTKKQGPGLWGPAVAGTVEEGETYNSNIIKEAEEELGLHAIKPQKGSKHRVSNRYNYFCQWYSLSIDRPATEFIIQEDEVEQLKWFTRQEFQQALQEHSDQFVEGLEQVVEEL